MPLFTKKKVPPDPGAAPLQVTNTAGAAIVELAPGVVRRYREWHTVLRREQPLPHSLGLAATLRGEGVTRTALNLAALLASDLEMRVALVELNVWWPGLASLAGLPEEGGLAVAVQAGATDAALDAALQPTSLEGLFLLPAGPLPEGQRSRFARSQALAQALQALSARFDLLVLDLPALLATGDSAPLAAHAAGLCVLVRQGVTPMPLLKLAMDQVEHLPVRGVVFNSGRLSIPGPLLRLLGGWEL